MKPKFPHLLLLVYCILFTFLAINPYDRAVWWAENIPILLIVGVLIVTYHKAEFSNISYGFMAVLIILHTIGGHFTFERVPFGFITDLFGFSRNHYDRVGHFSVGFYAFAIAELLMRKRLVRSKWILYLFPIFSIFMVAGGYEIIEWIYAVTADESAGIAVLGSQGDVWDAQKDMLADVLGSFFAMLVFYSIYRNKIQASLMSVITDREGEHPSDKLRTDRDA